MSARFEQTTTTTCGYCGVGCRLETHRVDGTVRSISPAMDGPANKGHTCVKGRFAHQFARSRDRLTAPLVRENEGFRLASWDEAIGRIVDAFTSIKAEHGPDAIAGLASSRGTNEDCYVMQRFMRAAIGTHNIDNCSRVCHSPTSFALRKSFGMSGATGSFDDFERADVALLVGVNPTQGHPVVGARIKQAALKGLKLITADPRRIELSDYGQIHLPMRPGTNAALLNGLCHVVIRDGLTDQDFIRERTEGYDAVAEVVEAYTPEAVEEITGIPADDLVAAAHMYAQADRACISWGLGVTEHLYGSEVVQLICNLALLTGNVGKPGAALLPLRGQNNVQGSSDHGALPDTYTDYKPVTDDEVTSRFEQRWGVSMKREPGMKIPEMFDAAVEGSLKAMYIFGEDVAQTDPDTAHVEKALSSLDFLVCQDIFESETTKFADVILPASSFLEKTGTFTNAERRLQMVEPGAEPPGSARTDFEIITTLSRAMGYDMGYETPADVMDEVAEMTPRYAGISHDRIGRDGLQWPVAPDGTDTPILYEEHFETESGLGHFAPIPYKPPGDAADDDFPLILVTGRRLEHYNAGNMTRRTENLTLMPHDTLEIHPEDAGALGLASGDEVRLRSRVGQVQLGVDVTDRIEKGHVFTAFHFPEVRTNLLIGQSSDVNTSCPEYKVVAVSVEPVGAEATETAPPAAVAESVLS